MIRLALVILFFILGIAIQVMQGIGSAWYLYLTAFILLATHFLFGNVWAAFSKIQKGKIGEAETLLKQIKKPNWLYKKHRAYYHFIKGMIALQHKELKDGEQHLNKALELGLRNDNDTAMARLNLAHISFVQQRYTTTKDQLKKIKTLQLSDLLVKKSIAELEDVLSKLR